MKDHEVCQVMFLLYLIAAMISDYTKQSQYLTIFLTAGAVMNILLSFLLATVNIFSKKP